MSSSSSSSPSSSNALQVQLIGAATKRALDLWWDDDHSPSESFHTSMGDDTAVVTYSFDDNDLGISIAQKDDGSDQIHAAAVVLSRAELLKIATNYLGQVVSNKVGEKDAGLFADEDEDEDDVADDMDDDSYSKFMEAGSPSQATTEAIAAAIKSVNGILNNSVGATPYKTTDSVSA